MREWPLARLTARHFYDYNTSAKSPVQPVPEIRYLLPRMLELLAEGADVHHSLELSLDRLGRCPEGSWTEAEQGVLDRFALAYFDAVLRGGPLGQGVRQWLDDPLSVLLMFDIGGLDIAPLLDLWLRCDDAVSTIQFVDATYWNFWAQRKYSNAFASDRPRFLQQISAWLIEPAHRRRFADKLLSADFLRAAQLQPPVGRTPFSVMTDGVFDELTQ